MSTEQEGHTPGPWFVCDADSRHMTRISANEGTGRALNGGIYIARVQGPDNRANARLIAAAPDLLKAGEGARQALWNALDHLGFECPDAHPAIVELDAAIARATGEA